MLATLILDNDSQKNLVSHELVQWLNLPTTPHPTPYQLGWVQKDGLCLTLSQHFAVTFGIGPFWDSIVFGVSPLDCVNFLLGLPYEHARNVVYHAKAHQYHLQQDRRTYVLTSAKPQ